MTSSTFKTSISRGSWLQVFQVVLETVDFGLEMPQFAVHLLRASRRASHVTQNLHVDVIRSLAVHVLRHADRHLAKNTRAIEFNALRNSVIDKQILEKS